jgi:hypothetical protein
VASPPATQAVILELPLNSGQTSVILELEDRFSNSSLADIGLKLRLFFKVSLESKWI